MANTVERGMGGAARWSSAARRTPHAARRALAGASAARPAFRVVTQNVDGLHAIASGGTASLPLELHGSLFRIRCTGCGLRRDDRTGIDATTIETLPHCEPAAEIVPELLRHE